MFFAFWWKPYKLLQMFAYELFSKIGLKGERVDCPRASITRLLKPSCRKGSVYNWNSNKCKKDFSVNGSEPNTGEQLEEYVPMSMPCKPKYIKGTKPKYMCQTKMLSLGVGVILVSTINIIRK